MIKNERQYRITKSQGQKFEDAIRKLEQSGPEEGVHPVLHQAQVNALRSQLLDLQAELAQYEALRSGAKTTYDFAYFDQIPSALIEARIAQGLTQEELAERLDLQPQQIQRYEATDYQSASLSRVAQVIRALDLPAPKGLDVPNCDFSFSKLLGRLKTVGMNEDFVKQRLLPRPSGLLAREQGETGGDILLEAAEGLSRIYGWTAGMLFGPEPLTIGDAVASTARFKLPARVNTQHLPAYTVYAHYLALLVLEATPALKTAPLPIDAVNVRKAIISSYGALSFGNALKFAWSLGIPVLPLNDPGTFHGACWRVRGRNVIVLKQCTKSVARWLFDLLHEYFHAATRSDLEEHPVIEESEMSPSRRNSEEEQAASRFAGDVLLDGRAEELAELCVATARGSVERLKSAVLKVSKAEAIPADVLANYMAFRLSLQGINWWGAANNLQQQAVVAIPSPRELLLGHADLTKLAPVDRNLLLRALEPIVLAFAGKIASGKSTLSSEVAKALDWKRVSFGDYVRIVAKSQGMEPSREVLQELGETLARTPDEFCRSMLAHFGWESGEPVVIDGIRHREIVDALRRAVAPLELRLVFIDVADEKRRERLDQERDNVTDKLAHVEKHSTEKQVEKVLPGIADLTVTTESDVNQVVQQIVTWVHQGDSTTLEAA